MSQAAAGGGEEEDYVSILHNALNSLTTWTIMDIVDNYDTN